MFFMFLFCYILKRIMARVVMCDDQGVARRRGTCSRAGRVRFA